MQISRNIVNGPKSNNYVLVGIRAIVCVKNPGLSMGMDGMGQHTFVFSMRLRNKMRVSDCY